MKKTWKECLYDLVFWIPSIFSLVGLFCIILHVTFDLLDKPLDGIWANVSFYSFWIFGALCILLFPFGEIRSYTKETFLRNKIRYLLFADSSNIVYMFFLFLSIITSFFYEELEKMLGIENTITIVILSGIATMGISSKLSKYCQKKIVHVETDKK